MASGNLKFDNTQSVEAYCRANGVAANAEGTFDINLVRNPKTNKLFASFNNGSTAALASKLDKSKPMVISECTDEDSGEQFTMIHNPSTANVEETITIG